jgi:D-glycerate 3-kinase
VNDQLATGYADIFKKLDYLSMLKPPCFEAVLDWRVEQEVRLIAKRREVANDNAIKGMNVKQVAEFVENFRRLTCHAMTVLPDLANETWELQADRLILSEVTSK